MLVLVVGCNGLSLKTADRESCRDTLRSVFRRHSPGPAAREYLIAHGIEAHGQFSPARAAEQVAGDKSPEGRLVLAELCDLAGREAEFWSPSQCCEQYLNAAYHASQVLFDQSDALTPQRRTDAEHVYNRAVARYLRRSSTGKLLPNTEWEQLQNSRGLGVSVRRDATVWDTAPFDEFQFADDYMALGVPSRKRPGLGVSLFAVRQRGWRDPDRQGPPYRFFPPLQAYPVTAVLRFEPGDGERRPPAVLELHDPLRYDAVAIGRRPEPLASDATTPLVYQVTQSDLEKFTYLGFLDPEREEHKTGLYLTHPYERGKIPVVLIHGLWSSPKTWTRAINDLLADPDIRDRYQFFVFQYPTGNPFIHSASILRRDIIEVRRNFDPDFTDRAFDQMVLIGHSMGGLIAKSMIASSGDAIWRLISEKPFDQLVADPAQKDLFQAAFFFEPVPEVKRVVYVAVPHRGSQISNNWLGQLGDHVIRRPNVLRQAHAAVLKENSSGFFNSTFAEGIPSSVRTLAMHSPMLLTVDKLPVSPAVTRHSIIAEMLPVAPELSNDGVVPYESSHLDGVASEKLVIGPHSCTDLPDVIAEFRRILLLHLATADGRAVEGAGEVRPASGGR